MGRRHTRIWRQLRAARTSALTPEERRQELRKAQERSDPPGSSADVHAQEPPGAPAGPAGDNLGR
jgi:hypothetical protein